MVMRSVLAASLALNGLLLWSPILAWGSPADRMTCRQARDEVLNKQSAWEFAAANGYSLIETHDFLMASDFTLRNLSFNDGAITFVYTAETFPETCGVFGFPGVDGSIVRVATDIAMEPTVLAVN